MRIPRVKWPAAVMLIGTLLCACSAPPARVLASAAAGADHVKVLDVVLEAPSYTPAGLGVTSLKNGGWYSGEMERKFCAGLADHFADAGVQARCTQSQWGAHVTFVPAGAPANHVLTIKPLRNNYMVHTRYGKVVDDGWASGASDPKFETLTTLVDTRSGQRVWEGLVIMNIAPVDPTGAGRYAKSLVEALKQAGLM